MKIGISFDGFATFGEAVSFAKEAVDAGASSLWFADHLGYREPVASCLAFLLTVKHAEVIPTAVSPYLREPMPVAMQLATLAEAGPGRVALALGVGNPLFLAENGHEIDKPIRVMREFVEVLRALWSGEPVHREGARFRLEGARMMFLPPQPIPIYLSPMKEQMLRLAGRIADGAVLSAGLSLGFVRHSLDIVENGAHAAGRDLSSIRRAGYISFMASKDGRRAVDTLRRKLAFLFRNRFIAENLNFTGIPIDQDAIIAAMSKRDFELAASFISDDAVEAFAVAGTPSQCCDRLQALSDAGLTDLVLMTAGDAVDQRLSLDVLRELV